MDEEAATKEPKPVILPDFESYSPKVEK